MRWAAHQLQKFLRLEVAAGVILMLAAGLALLCANTPLQLYYSRFLEVPFWGGTLLHWVNDGLMAIFFLLVALEIKREMVEGALSTRAQALLPLIAAAGGVLCPALIYV